MTSWKSSKLILKTQQRFKIQPMDSVETHAYETRKDLIFKKEKTKCNNITKQCKKWLTLIVLQKKT